MYYVIVAGGVLENTGIDAGFKTELKPIVPGVPEVLSITFSSINQKVHIEGSKLKYQNNLHLMQSR